VKGVSFYYESYTNSDEPDDSIENFNINRQTADPDEAQEFIINNMRLAYFTISNDIEGLTMTVNAQSCHKMMYFMTQTLNIKATSRPELNGMIDIILPNDAHDVSPSIMDMDLKEGETYDLNLNLAKIRNRFDLNSTVYLYLFCPFLKTVENNQATENGEPAKTEFKFQFKYQENKEYQDIKNKNYLRALLNSEIRAINTNSTDDPTNPEEDLTLYQKVKKEIIESPSSTILVENVLNLKTKFFGVTETQIDIQENLKNDDGFVVQTVNQIYFIL
jgi:hypothetical protein